MSGTPDEAWLASLSANESLIAGAVYVVIWLVGLLVRLAIIGTVPENRRPASSMAWLMAIFLLPVVGLVAYLVIGSPWVRGRRMRQQREVNQVLHAIAGALPTVPDGVDLPPAVEGVVRMNRSLTGLPCVAGEVESVHADAAELYAAMAELVDSARDHVHVEFYIQAWDEVTDVFFSACERAVARGVTVRLLLDHLGCLNIAGWGVFRRRLTEAGIQWHRMMPLQPLRRRLRRPDLRNHRKMLTVDGRAALIGSHNLIAPHYHARKNLRAGRAWEDLSVIVVGDVVVEIDAVFAMDWWFETGEQLGRAQIQADGSAPALEGAAAEAGDALAPAPARVGSPARVTRRSGATVNAMQIIPSGPGYPTEPNLRMFIELVHAAARRLTIVSPYFIPDEALLTAITSAAHRGVEVELFVGEQADQFLVGHAQRSYYAALLEAGVMIHLYAPPKVLHAKYMTVDDEVAVIGSSNMDFRSFALNYEVMLLAFGGDLDDMLRGNDEVYRAQSRVLTLDEWRGRSLPSRWVDNVCRLASALL